MAELFKDNLSLWLSQLPEGAQRPSEAAKPPSRPYLIFADQTGSQRKIRNNQKEALSAQTWAKSLPKDEELLLLVYGIAPPLYSGILLDWLQGSSKRKLVVIDDQIEPLYGFLQTLEATRLLQDRNFWLFYTEARGQQEAALRFFSLAYPHIKWHFSAIPPYLLCRQRVCDEINVAYQLLLQKGGAMAQEINQGALLPLRNFYSNARLLPLCRSSHRLRNSFAQVPAIICGAGPSLAKNRCLLHQLKDKALILAGGTATNALNAEGIDPHLNFGIDPNPTFMHRITASTSWMTPFLFSYRMNDGALERVTAEKLLLSFEQGLGFDSWLQRQLGLKLSPLISAEAYNVTHLCTLVALAMGCNPIIFVGVDLAYSQDCSYASGVSTLATHSLAKDFITKRATEEIIERHDIYGKKVKTLWKWVIEAVWYGSCARRNEKTTFLNCTEGGLPLPNIPNLPLRKAADDHLQKQQELLPRLYRALMECEDFSHITSEQIEDQLKLLLESFQKTEVLIEQEEKNEGLEEEEEPKRELKEFKYPSFKEKLKKEPVYDFYLEQLENYIKISKTPEAIKLQSFKNRDDEKKLFLKEWEKELKETLLFAVTQNKAILQKELRKPKYLGLNVELQDKPNQSMNDTEITQEAGLLQGEQKLFWPKGVASLYGLLHYAKGVIDGEQLYYYQNGQLRARLHYKQGLLHDKQEIYSPEGVLLVLSHFNHGKRNGVEEHFNHDGTPLYSAKWVEGKVIGQAKLWHANGKLARLFTYDEQGKLIEDRQWAEGGEELNSQPLLHNEYLQSIFDQIDQLRGSLAFLKTQVETIAETTKEIAFSNGMEEAWLKVQKELFQIYSHQKKAEELHRLLQQPMKTTSEDTEEQFMITPSFIAEIEQAVLNLEASVNNTIDVISCWQG